MRSSFDGVGACQNVKKEKADCHRDLLSLASVSFIWKPFLQRLAVPLWPIGLIPIQKSLE